MKIRKTLFAGLALLFFLGIIVQKAHSQSYYFDKYDVRDGLAQSKVYSFIQDKSGFLWIGTAIGVSKFDGTNFKNFSTESGLSENGVKSIITNSKGVMWFGHIGGGVSRAVGSKFEKIVLKGITHDITSMAEDAKGRIWLSTVGDGTIRIDNPTEKDPAKVKYTQFKSAESLSDFVFFVYTRKNGTTLFVTDLGVKTYNDAKNNFDYFKQGELPAYFQVTCGYEDLKSNVWFGS
jgi:hypothetical protein